MPPADPQADPILAAARTAADAYVEAWLAERHIVNELATTPVRFLDEMTDAHNRVSRAGRKAFKRMKRAIDALNGVDRQDEATDLYLDVLERLGDHRMQAAEAAQAMEVSPR